MIYDTVQRSDSRLDTVVIELSKQDMCSHENSFVNIGTPRTKIPVIPDYQQGISLHPAPIFPDVMTRFLNRLSIHFHATKSVYHPYHHANNACRKSNR